MVANWLVGIGSVLAGVASVWTVYQQRQLNRHSRRLKELEKSSADS